MNPIDILKPKPYLMKAEESKNDDNKDLIRAILITDLAFETFVDYEIINRIAAMNGADPIDICAALKGMCIACEEGDNNYEKFERD